MTVSDDGSFLGLLRAIHQNRRVTEIRKVRGSAG